MGDIEELLLTRNLPGKYSRWDEERDDTRLDQIDFEDRLADLEDEADDPMAALVDKLGDTTGDVVEKVLNADIPDSIRDGILNERSGKHNTGVKGVLADYKANQALKEAERQAKIQEREAILTRMVQGARISNEDIQSSEFVQTNPTEEDDDDEDDDFLKEYRKKRLQELQKQSNLPKFGYVKEITDSDFIDEVEKVDPRVFVIVHLYETSIPSSVRMNRFLEEIARDKPNFKFLRMNASSSGIEIDRVTLPILNIYKNGESVDVIAGIAVEYGEFFNKEEIEWLLETHISNL